LYWNIEKKDILEGYLKLLAIKLKDLQELNIENMSLEG
jgi:hypothetical protein